MILFWHRFRAHRTGLLVWALVTAFLVGLIAQSASAVLDANAFLELMESLPPALQAIYGVPKDLAPVDGYVVTSLGREVALVLSLYAVLIALGAVTREVDRRTIDFLLALPVRRRQLVLTGAGVMVVNTGLLAAWTWLVLCLSLGAAGLDGSWGGYALMVFNQWLIALAFGSLALLSSIRLNDYGFAVKLWIGVVAASYVLEMVLAVAGMSRWERFFSPFSYAHAVDILRYGTLPWVDALVLAAVSVVVVILAVFAIERKSITT